MGKAIRKDTVFNSVLNENTVYRDYYCNNGSNVLDLSWNDLTKGTMLLDGSGYTHIHNGICDQETVHQYANKLCELSGDDYDRVFFANSGSDAIESAIKIAKMYYHNKGNTKRKKIVTAKDSFHGNTITGLSISDFGERNNIYKDILYKDNVVHIDFSKNEAITQLESIGDPGEILCVIIEPYQIHTKFCSNSQGYNYSKLKKFCIDNNILLIVDEIYTGGGKIPNQNKPTYWAWQDKKINDQASHDPDMIVCGKAITSGLFPLSGVILHKQVTNQLEDNIFEHSFTYANHGLGCAVGLYVLDYMQNNNIIMKNTAIAMHIENQIAKIKFTRPNYELKSNGLFLSVNCPTFQEAKDVQKKCRDKGFIFGQTFVIPGTLLMCPNFAMSADQIDDGIEMLTNEIESYGN